MWLKLANLLGVDKLVVYFLAALIGAAALGFAYWWVTDGAYDRGVAAEKARWEAKQEAAEDEAEADSWQLVGNINDIDWKANEAKQATAQAEANHVPVIQSQASIFYLANPNCRPPDRLWRENDQLARDLAAAAGLGVGSLSGGEGAGQ